jgi:DNA repair exonuclease SbcCD ATPase subunit
VLIKTKFTCANLVLRNQSYIWLLLLSNQKALFMNSRDLLRHLSIPLLAGGVLFGSIAWQPPHTGTSPFMKDTVPERQKKVRDIDDAIEELEKGRVELEKTLKDKDWEKMQQEIRSEAEKQKIDVQKMQADIQSSIKQIQSEEIKKQIANAKEQLDAAEKEIVRNTDLKDEERAKIHEDLAKAMKEIDMEKIKAETEHALAQVNMQKIQEELQKAQQMNMDKVEAGLQKMKPEIEKSIRKAQEGIDKARKELSDYKNLIDQLDRDGLLDKKGNYTITYRHGDLLINGKKQPEETKKRYEQFLNGKKDFTIKKDADGFDIDNGEHRD